MKNPKKTNRHVQKKVLRGERNKPEEKGPSHIKGVEFEVTEPKVEKFERTTVKREKPKTH
ncbi:MAG: hypothetical protein K940chlam8_00617 [Chlamydiae bacterium]|nr:hypothetical protein [Chlamydiota bacterium]